MIEVVAAILRRNNRYLLAKRPDDKHQGGKWEFPGGKVERNESRYAALRRECFEELGVTIAEGTESEPFDYVEFDYGDKHVAITFYLIEDFSGESKDLLEDDAVVIGKESQIVKWFDSTELVQLEFPKANSRAVKKISELSNGVKAL